MPIAPGVHTMRAVSAYFRPIRKRCSILRQNCFSWVDICELCLHRRRCSVLTLGAERSPACRLIVVDEVGVVPLGDV